MRISPEIFQPRKLKFLSIFIAGFLIFWFGYFYPKQQAFILSFNSEPAIEQPIKVSSPPTQIKIESAQIDLPVVQTNIIKGIWEVPTLTAAHLNTSASPGETSNIVIYGHNKAQVFGNLLNVKVGDTIEIKTGEGKVFSYLVSETFKVTPDKIDVVEPTDYEVLTVYTCTGFFDRERYIVRALPVN